MTSPRTRTAFQNWRRSERGASAIEFALIFPLIVMIYVGMIDLHLYVSTNRKIANAADTVGDLVTQSVSTISAATIDDMFKAARLALKPMAEDAVGIDVLDYRIVDGALKQQWRRKSSSGPACTAPDTSGLTALMTADNDIVIAVVCTQHEPAMGKALNKYVLGSVKFSIRHEVQLRPRESNTLTCLDC